VCGIAGIVRFDGAPVERRRLEAMNRAIAHRGPDGEGYWIDGPVGLAHRRLAIIDLSTGEQPMFGEDGRVVTVFNGEIYNFQDLRARLENRHKFKTQSDTEVLVQGWDEWGTGLLSHLNGMFAFAIYDRKTKKLLLARDRLGVKPLYYYRDKDVLAFASEMGALLASGLVPNEIDREALDLYLHYQYVPAPLTIYRGVRKLEPAQSMEVDASGASLLSTYWDLLRVAPDLSPSLPEWVDRLDSLLEDAVRIRLISDVPFGAFLSGGTDSGLVVAKMARRLQEPVRTFSIGIADGDDELPLAMEVAKRFGTRHEEFRVSPEGLTLIPRLCRHFGEPFADSSAVPTYYVSQIARSRVKMVLTGDGGDEMFAGYRTYSYLANTRPDGLPKAKPVPIDRPRVSEIPRHLWQATRRVAAGLKRRMLRRPPNGSNGTVPWFRAYDASMSHFTAGERAELLGNGGLSSEDYFVERFPFAEADSVVAAAQFCDLKSYLPGDILTKVDRMSMANSLEVRSPLLDYRIAELAFSMPTEMKLPNARLDGSTGKHVLKQLASRFLGERYVYRPKQGFGIPVSRWLREDRAHYLQDVLVGSASPIFDLVDRYVVRRLVAEHLAGTRDHSAKLWNLLMLDGWFRNVHRSAGGEIRGSASVLDP
jgi:asparagine synthase (glutamine-hydrolysing)